MSAAFFGFLPAWLASGTPLEHALRQSSLQAGAVAAGTYYQPTLLAHVEIAIRTQADPEQLIPAVRRAMLEVDPDLQTSSVQTMDQIVEESIGSQRFAAHLLEVFGGAARRGWSRWPDSTVCSVIWWPSATVSLGSVLLWAHNAMTSWASCSARPDECCLRAQPSALRSRTFSAVF